VVVCPIWEGAFYENDGMAMSSMGDMGKRILLASGEEAPQRVGLEAPSCPRAQVPVHFAQCRRLPG
jgi:hypothetical protein